jgi:hypothetical protein
MTRLAAIVTTVVLAVAARAGAQDRVVLTGYAELGIVQLSASRTFDAVSGNHRAPVAGGGAQISNVWRRLFVDVGISALSKSGERVSIDDGSVERLGVPIQVELRHIDFAAGWRHSFGRLSAYAGAGLTRVKYTEADPSEPLDLEVAASGPLILAGLDLAITRWARVGAVVRGRKVPGILGESGASAYFEERSAGGMSTSVRVSFSLLPGARSAPDRP